MAQTQTETALQNGTKPSPSKGKRTRKYRSVGGASGGDLKDKTAISLFCHSPKNLTISKFCNCCVESDCSVIS